MVHPKACSLVTLFLSLLHFRTPLKGSGGIYYHFLHLIIDLTPKVTARLLTPFYANALVDAKKKSHPTF